jgi:hypothetical protein
VSDFDVSRIVPSTRDFAAAVQTRRKGLALVPILEGDVEAHVKRLDDIDVRAFAIRESGEACMVAARTTESTPIALLTAVQDTEGCQRARFFGADCVELAADAFAEQHKTVQSMRMRPAARVHDVATAERAAADGALLMVVRADVDTVFAVADVVDRRVTLIADVAGADAEAFKKLDGRVDAAIVPVEEHERDDFEALLDELD